MLLLRGVSRADVAKLDVGEDDRGVGSGVLDVGGLAGGGSASAASDTGLGSGPVGGVVGIEPQHVGGVVVPDAHDEDDAVAERLAHGGETTLLLEGVGVRERGLLRGAEAVGDGVAGGHASDVDLGVLDDLAALHVNAADLAERARGGTGVRDELGHDGHLGARVDGEALAVERLVAHAEGVEIATVGIADALVPAVDGAVFASAAVHARDGAGVRGVGGRDGVGLPDIHLIAARAVVARSGVRVVGRRGPANDVSLLIEDV